MNNPGKLDKRIEIWGKVAAEDSAGQSETDELGTQVYDDTMLAEVWAQVSPRTGSLLTGRPADTILSKVTHKIISKARSTAISNALPNKLTSPLARAIRPSKVSINVIKTINGTHQKMIVGLLV